MDWKAQWDQLKTELDALNPKYDAATARVRELEATLALREKEKAEAEAARDAEAMNGVNLRAECEQHKADVAAGLARIKELSDGISLSQQAVRDHKARAERAIAGLNAANAAQAAASKAITEALHASV